MSNPYFQFKKFAVYHDRCAMKVGTDGVLLGAWTRIREMSTVLDIGTGTGLIVLMLAQRSDCRLFIDAIDIDPDAVEQAKENIIRSGFTNIETHQTALQVYVDNAIRQYDLIISNPPYFSSSLPSPNLQRTLARHAASLSMPEFVNSASQLLSNKGYLSVIYPYSNKEELVSLAEKAGLFVFRITNVYPTPTSEPKRILLEFSKVQDLVEETNLIVELERHVYSPEFKELVKDFYLNL